MAPAGIDTGLEALVRTRLVAVADRRSEVRRRNSLIVSVLWIARLCVQVAES